MSLKADISDCIALDLLGLRCRISQVSSRGSWSIACFHLGDVGDERLIYTTLHCFAVHICSVLNEAVSFLGLFIGNFMLIHCKIDDVIYCV
jgi:hypothetical protein